MPTRFYFPASGTAPASPAVSGEWGHNNNVRRPCAITKASTALAATAYVPDGADHLVDDEAMFVQFVSPPLLEQTINAQAVKWQFQALEDHANNNLNITIKVFLCSRDGATIKGTIIAQRRDTLEVPTATMANRSDSVTSTLQVAETGDRLVIEVGLGGLPTATSGTQGHNGQIRFGDDQATDLPEDDTDTTTTKNPWLEFADVLKWSREVSLPQNQKAVRVGDGMSTTERVW